MVACVDGSHLFCKGCRIVVSCAWLKLFYGVKKVQAITQFVELVQGSVLCSIDHLNYRDTGLSLSIKQTIG